MPATMKTIVKDKGWNRIKKDLQLLNGMFTKIGLWGEGNPSENVAARGAVHEFGDPYLKGTRIPQRPFGRQAFDGNLNSNKRAITIWYKMLLDGKLTPLKVMKKIGERHAGQMRDAILRGKFTKLADITVKRKKSSKPLVDQAIMKNSITHKEGKKL